MNKMKIKELFKLILLICTISICLLLLKTLILLFIQRTDFTDHISSMVSMIVLSCIGLFICKKQDIKLCVFPAHFSYGYIIISVVGILLLIFTPSNYSGNIETIAILIFGSIVTPIFEELIFRGYVWNKLNALYDNEWITYIISTCLFALWHLGYINSIAFRVQENLLNIMIWKVITGLCYGIILGLIRKKTKNCYSTILIHGILNIFAR